MDTDEPDLIKYERIILPEDPSEPGTSKEESSESSSGEEGSDDESRSISPSKDPERANRIRAETIDLILDCVVPPKPIEHASKKYLLRLSRLPSNRNEIAQLSKKFEDYLRERQVRMKGYCPVRRELYDLLFDELIRQSTIFCPERGALLLRVRDEFRMTLGSYEKLFENGVEYGTRKALEAETETQSLQLQYSQLEAELARAEQRIQELKAEMDAEEELSRQRIDVKQLRHEEKMEFLRRANKQLKEQLSYIT